MTYDGPDDTFGVPKAATPEYMDKNIESFFGGDAPLSEAVGWAVVLGFGMFFSIFTTLIVMADKYYGSQKAMTSEHFK